jgi:hypothetical protein
MPVRALRRSSRRRGGKQQLLTLGAAGGTGEVPDTFFAH